MTPINKPSFDRFEIKWIPIKLLVRHPKIQRPYSEGWAKTIAADFDPEKYNPLDVVPRGDRFLVFGGQHRLGAAKLIFDEEQKLPCRVHEDCPLEKQAAIAIGIDTVKPWRTIDNWHRRVTAREEHPLKIMALLARHDLKVALAPAAKSVRAVRALEEVWTKLGGEPVLDRTLKILSEAYGDDVNAFDGMLVHGLGLLLHAFPTLDDKDLSTRLARHAGPDRTVGQARDYAKTNGISARRAMAEKLLQVYNKHRHKNGRLEFR